MDPFISQDVYSVLCCPLQHFGPGDGIWNPCPTRVTCPHLSWPYRQYLNEYRALDLDRVGCRICQKVVRIFNQIFSCLHSSYSVWICFHGFFFSYFHITTRQLRFKIKIFLPLDEQPSWAKKSYLPEPACHEAPVVGLHLLSSYLRSMTYQHREIDATINSAYDNSSNIMYICKH